MVTTQIKYDQLLEYCQDQVKKIHKYQEVLAMAKVLIDTASIIMCDSYHGSDMWSKKFDEFKIKIHSFLGYY